MILDNEVHFDVRMPPVKLVEELWHQSQGHTLGNRHPKRTAQAAVQTGRASRERLHRRLNGRTFFQKRFSLRSQSIAIPLLGEKTQPQPLLQRGYAANDGGLIDAE